MAKLLCSLFLAGFVFQANAFSIATDPPNPPLDQWIPSILKPVDWISNIGSFFNPFNWVTSIDSFFNPWNWVTNIASNFNPWNWVTNIASFFNPFTYIPDFLNPFHYFPNLNPANWIPNLLKYLPNPISWIPGIGYDRCTLQADVGPCKASETRYYYDQNANACMEFTYGGCKGNRNNFKQKDKCEKACRGH